MSTQPSDLRLEQGSVQPKGFPSLPLDWDSEWKTFLSQDGSTHLFETLHLRRDAQGPRALAVFHGLGEYSGRYLHFPHYLDRTVDAVYALDHRGHGRSEGIRGHVERFDLYAQDVQTAIQRLDEALKQKWGHSEIHVLGHSMGGLITLVSLFQNTSLPVKSVSISAPLLGVKVRVPPVKKMAALALSKMWGSLQMATTLDAQFLSHDLEVIKAYEKDRLVHNKVTARFFTELQSAMAGILARSTGFNYPLQFLIPMQDHVVDADVALQFFRNLKFRDKVLKTYPDFFHEAFNELGKETVFGDLTNWIRMH